MRIALASDHAGFELKASMAEHLGGLGHDVTDLGTDSTEPVDYPIFCAACARYVVAGKADLGIVMGGSGQGEQIAANKVRGCRAALCHDEYTARFARHHNNANVLAIGARIVATELALDIVDVFVASTFDGGRHARRVEELTQIEDEEAALGPSTDH